MNEHHSRTYFTACSSKEDARLPTTGANHPPHPDAWDPSGPAITSQTQKNLDDTSTLDSDNEDNCVAVSNNGLEYGKVISQLNTLFDESDYYLSTEIKAITDHRF